MAIQPDPSLTGVSGDTLEVVVTEAAAMCDQALANAQSTLEARITECIQPCKVGTASCDSCIRGMIERELERVGQTIMKCDERAIRSMVSHLSELAGLAGAVGVPFPGDTGGAPVSGGNDVITTPVPPDGGTSPPVQPPTGGGTPTPPTTGTNGGGGTVTPPITPPTAPPTTPPVVPPTGPGGGVCPDVANPFDPLWANVLANAPVGSLVPNADLSCPSGYALSSAPVIAGQLPLCAVCVPLGSPVNPPVTPPSPPTNGGGLTNDDKLACCVQYYADPALGGSVDYDPSTDECVIQRTDAYGNVVVTRQPVPVCNPSIPPVTPPTSPPPSPSPIAVKPPIGAAVCDPDKAAYVLESASEFSKVFGLTADDLAAELKTIFGDKPLEKPGITDWLSDPLKALGIAVVTGFVPLINGILSIADSTTIVGGGCFKTDFLAVAMQAGIGNLFGGWFGFVPDNITQSNRYILNLVCQYLLPSGGDANDLYAKGFIDTAQWRLLIHANGLCEPWQQIIVDSQVARPGVSDAISARRRKLIDDSELEELFLHGGVRDKRWQQVFYNLYDFIPGPGDLVTFMVRDVFDPDVVNTYGLDSEFEQKFQGKAADWAEAQGMTDEVFRYFWRSHWQYASPGQIYEMVHRLRGNDRNPDEPFAEITFDLNDARKALEVQDIAPYFVDRLLAISYRPLTRVDVRRAYEIGVLSDDDLYRSYLDLGYSPPNARKLADFARLDSNPKRAKRAGLPSQTDVLKWYGDVVIDRTEARQLLRDAGVQEKYLETTLDGADSRRRARDRTAIVASLKKRYMSGEFDDADINGRLTGAGVDPNRIGDTVQSWSQIRDAKFKQPTVAMLCGWWSRGLITLEEYMRRVANLGYKPEDATRVISICAGNLQDRQKKDAERAAKEANAAATKAAKEKAAAIKAAAKAAKDALPCKPAPKPVCPPASSP